MQGFSRIYVIVRLTKRLFFLGNIRLRQQIQGMTDEFVFRLNEGNCRQDTVDRLDMLVRGVAGKRLTYVRMLVVKK